MHSTLHDDGNDDGRVTLNPPASRLATRSGISDGPASRSGWQRGIRLVLGSATISPPLADAALTLVRVFAGLSLALAHGSAKLPPSEGFVTGVGQMGFPVPIFWSWAAGLSEFVGGLLLAAGLATRPAAFFIACTTATAGFIRHAPDPYQRKELALLYLTVALMFLVIGSGRLGLDRFLRKRI